MNNIKNVTVLGTGVLGAQIAFQTAYSGFSVSAYDINEEALEAARKRFKGLAETYKSVVAGATPALVEAALSRLSLFSDLSTAVVNADLVIEAVPEILEVKLSIFQKLGEVAPEKTIFATNSSTLLPSDIKDATGRPAKFLALHFANNIWQFNIAEVMGTAETDPVVFDQVAKFAKDIGMVPALIRKEKAGYILNSLSIPFLVAALELAAFDYATPADIDKVWQISFGSDMGPFNLLDIIGMTTPYNILSNGTAQHQQIAVWIKKNYIDQGKLGIASGEGFYTYTNT